MKKSSFFSSQCPILEAFNSRSIHNLSSSQEIHVTSASLDIFDTKGIQTNKVCSESSAPLGAPKEAFLSKKHSFYNQTLRVRKRSFLWCPVWGTQFSSLGCSQRLESQSVPFGVSKKTVFHTEYPAKLLSTLTNRCNSTNAVRKTFKKLYEQKDLVRNSKDQYGVVCDSIWKESHQRLTLTNLVDPTKNNFEKLCFPWCPVVGTPNKLCLFDFFDTKRNKKMQDSKNRHIIQIQSTTSYQENWKASLSEQTKFVWLTVLEGKTKYFSQIKTQNPFGISESSAPLGSTNFILKDIQIKSNRKNTSKLLQRDDTSNATRSDRSVVNTALEKYSKRIKIKTLNELGSKATR